jgi:hypothetical protein
MAPKARFWPPGLAWGRPPGQTAPGTSPRAQARGRETLVRTLEAALRQGHVAVNSIPRALCWDLARIKRRCGGRALLSECGKARIGRRDPAPRQLLDALAVLPQCLIRAGELGLGQLLPLARRRSDLGSKDCALDISHNAVDGDLLGLGQLRRRSDHCALLGLGQLLPLARRRFDTSLNAVGDAADSPR